MWHQFHHGAVLLSLFLPVPCTDSSNSAMLNPSLLGFAKGQLVPVTKGRAGREVDFFLHPFCCDCLPHVCPHVFPFFLSPSTPNPLAICLTPSNGHLYSRGDPRRNGTAGAEWTAFGMWAGILQAAKCRATLFCSPCFIAPSNPQHQPFCFRKHGLHNRRSHHEP